MDIFTDLSSHAVSFLCVYQDVCKLIGLETNISSTQVSINLLDLNSEPYKAKSVNIGVIKRINVLMWNCPQNEDVVVSFFFSKIKVIIEVYELEDQSVTTNKQVVKNENLNTPDNPYAWRQHFRKILYQYPQHRTALTNALEYMPLLVILALGAEKANAYNQRLYQVWGNGATRFKEKKEDKYIRNEISYTKWWNNPTKDRKAKAIEFLEDEKKLMAALELEEVAVPFESLLNQELDEVDKSRTLRKFLPENLSALAAKKINDISDPLERAKQMKLRGIAFSGGGIRSATFNLGVLQKLSEMKQLHSYDFISTVSGGGYIGSWFISWLKRVGSIDQLSLLLNSRESADPMAEEVRPIRWLRMYSNYLSPNTGIMSADSWTMGLTWLRNTLINQAILVLLLCSMLSAIALVFEFWNNISFTNNFHFQQLFWWTFLILCIGAAITSSGMRLYDREYAPPSKYKFGSSKYMPALLLFWAAASSFLISAWMKSELPFLNSASFDKNTIIYPTALAALIAMLILAFFGRYYLRSRFANQQAWFWLWVFISSAAASCFGAFLLTICWQIMSMLKEVSTVIQYLPQKLIFILGLPLILETYTLSVIIRMLLMGNLFPDERREWWGRLGAVIHRFILIWIIITAGALVLPDALSYYYSKYSVLVPAIFGGWGAIIGVAVKLAFKSKSTAESKQNSGLNFTEIFIRFAPYLFMIGFLLLGSTALDAFRKLIGMHEHSDEEQQLRYFILTIALFVITMFFSYRLGVNEFSLHHFYRNRLTRAYLGATRRRTDRESTANNFTGFDNQDDIKIASLTAGNGYEGPYPILNTALNASTVSELDRQDRKAESFTFSPLYCGYDFSSTRSAADTRNGIFQYGYRPTKDFSEPDGPTLGTAMAVSGAAVNPNMGYHSSAPTAFLLTIFNVRLGRWIGNTRLGRWKRSDPTSGLAYLIYDMIGKSDINKDYVCLSDGGHFDNMGIYELVRRRCSYILLCDAEEDVQATCEGLANAIRRCRIDFGVEIKINLTKIIEKNKDTGFVESHTVEGTVRYPGDEIPSGKIIYVKTALTGKESVDIRQYYLANDKFPQQSTGDQFFDEAQFESYRKLGYQSIKDIHQIT
ncbi:hypothetical protein EZ449_03670 [Pedobacter frigidisoli]|uniref:PNPLA domain-containing protein n=1 Tax=Pedobacter frigidisoli TaxID=2530455 RepID=A0A4R0P650_9SPHI|nr:patatin-like phospholipase family protein [Pedobacter frigidisoli]TCD12127.1 hypothetical protein EZ449_03670 [Pedobacter frigidisoli]